MYIFGMKKLSITRPKIIMKLKPGINQTAEQFAKSNVGGYYNPRSKRIVLHNTDPSAKTHELTHWMQDRKGKMKNYGKSSLSGIRNTFGAEQGAYYKTVLRAGQAKGKPATNLRKLKAGVLSVAAAALSTAGTYKSKFF